MVWPPAEMLLCHESDMPDLCDCLELSSGSRFWRTVTVKQGSTTIGTCTTNGSGQCCLRHDGPLDSGTRTSGSQRPDIQGQISLSQSHALEPQTPLLP